MYDALLNQVIDRVVCDRAFSQEVLLNKEEVLAQYQLSIEDMRQIIAAVEADFRTSENGEPFSALRQLARFGPLFAAASASSTKSG